MVNKEINNQLSDHEFMRYSPHLLLQEVGEKGQLALRRSRVLIIGLGGLGSPVALYLGAAGVGHLTLADDDQVELSNLQRQIVFDKQQLKESKVTAAKARLLQLNSELKVTTIPRRLTEYALNEAVARVDLVIDCTDNMPSRQQINAACVQQQKPLIIGAGIRMEGQLISFDTRREGSACYHCLFPYSETQEMANCSNSGVLGPIVGTIGSLQALEAIKYLTGMTVPSFNRLMRFDGNSLQWQTLTVTKNPRCPVCSGIATENTARADIAGAITAGAIKSSVNNHSAESSSAPEKRN